MKSKKYIFDENKDEIIKLFNKGTTLLDMEKIFNISRHTLKKYLSQIGIRRKEAEKQKIMQEKRKQSFLAKYGVENPSQINDKEMQERRLRGVRKRSKGRWSGKENPNYKNKIGNNFGFKSGKRHDIGNFFFRSSWEANYARILNHNNKKWKYETTSFELSNETTYTPDFYLIEENSFVEIKGHWFGDSFEKFNMFKTEYPNVKIQVIEKKEYNLLIKEFSFINLE